MFETRIEIYAGSWCAGYGKGLLYGSEEEYSSMARTLEGENTVPVCELAVEN